MSHFVVIVVFSPRDAAPAVREALAKAGAGAVGDYSGCSFTAPGQGRFTPGNGAHPHIGVPGRDEVVDEVRIEVVCPRHLAAGAVRAMLAVHPYEEVAWHAVEALTLDDLDHS